MKHKKIIKIICYSFLAMLLSCSYRPKTTFSDDGRKWILIETTTYRNIYNGQDKLSAVFMDGKNYFGSSYSTEYHYFYKENDTVLLRKETYDIQPDGKKTLYSCMASEDSIVTWTWFDHEDTVRYIRVYYENGNQIRETEVIYEESGSHKNIETTYRYDAENRISQIDVTGNEKVTTQIYKYEIINDTLITCIYTDNVLERTEKEMEKGDYSIAFFYEQNHLTESIEKKQTDKDSYLTVKLSYDLNMIDSSFYHCGKIIKTVIGTIEKNNKTVQLDETKEGATLMELIDLFAGEASGTYITFFEYDKQGNLTKESKYKIDD